MRRTDWRRCVEELAAEYGAAVEPTKSGHLRIRHPTGWFAIAPGSPSDWRSLANLRKTIRRAQATPPRHSKVAS